MAQMPNNQQVSQIPPDNPPPPSPKYRLRPGLIAIIAAAAVAAFVINHIKPTITWVGLMAWLGVPTQNQGRYSALCVLGIVIVAFLLIVRTLGFRQVGK